MAKNSTITAEFVRTILDYNLETGELRWKDRSVKEYGSARLCKRWNSSFAGKVAGGKNRLGYIAVSIRNRTYSAHRVIWLWMTGEHPSHEIDHINMNPSDNRWANLRPATRKQNQGNTSVKKTSKSGLKGVKLDGNRYVARICGKYIGHYDCPAGANFAYQIAADIYYGEFARPI